VVPDMTEDFLLELYKRSPTIFTLKEVSLIFPQIPYQNLKSRLHYAVSVGKLQKLRKGIYAKENFEPLELANKIYTPSYISLETVLSKEGIVFQKYATISVVSYLTRHIKVGPQEIFYRKIKNEVLLNNLGLKEESNYFVASKERAFLDAIFLYKDYHFDNLRPFDWEKVREMSRIYASKTLEKRVAEYYQIFCQEHV